MNFTSLNILIFCLFAFLLDVKLSYGLNCYNFIPYAYNESYSFLPKNKTFCSNTMNGKIIFSTDEYSGRIISEINSKNKIIVFGESQLLGIDWSKLEDKNKHDLENIFPNHSITIYASINNGPYQVINNINKIVIDEMVDFDEILLGFNYGADIFRIQENWDPEDFIPLKPKSMDLVLKTPVLYDLIILKGLINNKFFSMHEIKNSDIRKQFLNLNSVQLKKSIESYLSEIEKIVSKFKKKPILVIYPPYWGYKENSTELNSKISKRFYAFVCNKRLKRIFKKTLIGVPNKTIKLTKDKKHFSMGSLTYKNHKEICINYIYN